MHHDSGVRQGKALPGFTGGRAGASPSKLPGRRRASRIGQRMNCIVS